MTRKRFCKKLMGLGASRNEAKRLAERVTSGQSFQEEYYFAVTLGFWRVGVSMDKSRRMMKKLAAAFRAAMIELDPVIALALSPTPSRTDKQQ